VSREAEEALQHNLDEQGEYGENEGEKWKVGWNAVKWENRCEIRGKWGEKEKQAMHKFGGNHTKNEEYTQNYGNKDMWWNREIDEIHNGNRGTWSSATKSGRVNARNWERSREIGKKIRY
jgi:hypothetical protein